MTNVYALSDYIVTITGIPTGILLDADANSYSIGGSGQNGYEGSFLDSIRVTRSSDTYSTEGDATGSWVHNKSLNRTGSVTININQISTDVIILSTICKAFENTKDKRFRKGMKVTVSPSYNPNLVVAEAYDCFVGKQEDQDLGSSATTQSWTLTAGRVEIYPNAIEQLKNE